MLVDKDDDVKLTTEIKVRIKEYMETRYDALDLDIDCLLQLSSFFNRFKLACVESFGGYGKTYLMAIPGKEL